VPCRLSSPLDRLLLHLTPWLVAMLSKLHRCALLPTRGVIQRAPAVCRIPDGARFFGGAITNDSKLKGALLQHLKQAELKGWTSEELKAALSMEVDTPSTAHDELLSLVNELELNVEEIYHNSPAGVLYQQALMYEDGSAIVDSGALAVKSGKKTGRSPLDKRVVVEESSEQDVWWGKVNIPLEYKSFLTNRERAVDYLNTRKRLYVVDGFGGWDPDYRVPVRVITSRAYHALFMQNMLVPPKPVELALFNKPFVIFNAGVFPCNRRTEGMTSSTSVAVSFKRREMVILGTQYAGEMKKGVFTIMNYLMPLMPNRDLPPAERALPLHASANIGPDNDVSIFFGLSGTGKTTLSADPKRDLIGDDEHVASQGCLQHRGRLLRQVHRSDPREGARDFRRDPVRQRPGECGVRRGHWQGGLRRHQPHGEHARGLPSPVHSQRSHPRQSGPSPQADHPVDLRRIRYPSSDQQTHARASHVPFHQWLHCQGGRDRGGRQ